MWRDWIKRVPDVNALEFDHVFMAYLPDKDQDGNVFDVTPWELKALKIQGKLFGGATSISSKGSYRKLDKKGASIDVLIEETKMVVSYVKEKDFTEKALKEVADFLKEYGAKTNQETVAFTIDQEMFYIDMPTTIE